MQRAQIGPWKIEYDREATQAAYAAWDICRCTCQECQNYMANVPSFPFTVLQFFDDLGIDPAKPTEVIGDQGIYHLVGKYISGEDIWQPVLEQSQDGLDKSAERARAVQWFSPAENFFVGFTQSIELQPNEIPPEQTLQMELHLPWLLDEPCTE